MVSTSHCQDSGLALRKGVWKLGPALRGLRDRRCQFQGVSCRVSRPRALGKEPQMEPLTVMSLSQ